MTEKTEDQMVNEYTADIENRLGQALREIADKAAREGPRFDDETLCMMLMETIVDLVAIDGGDAVQSVFSKQFSSLIGIAAQLHARTLLKIVALEAMQGTRPN